MKKPWTYSEICEKNDEYVIDYACEDGCVNVKTWRRQRLDDWKFARRVFPSEFPQEHPVCTDLLCRWGEAMSTRTLVAVEPRRLLMTDVGTETAFRLDQRKQFQKSKHLLRSKVNWCDQTSVDLHLRRSTVMYMPSTTDFDKKRNHCRGQSSPRLLFGHTGCWSNPKYSQRSHGGFRSWPPRPHLQILHQEIFWLPW